MWQIILLTILAATWAAAETYHVDVGRTGLNFKPSILYDVAEGDTINFHFYPSNHSVAESTFDKPCKPKSGGVDVHPIFSGFVPVDDGVAKKMWSMTINNTDPIWLYCSQGSHQHCRMGQSMVINPVNNTDQTLDAYMIAAQTANVSSPAEMFGGMLVDDDGGQPEGGPSARPTNSLSHSSPASTSTTSTTKPTSGVAPLIANVVWEMGLWGLLAAVFITTL